MHQIYHLRVPWIVSSCKWVAPLDGIMKLNVDASLVVDGWMGLGVIARDSSSGSVLFAANRRMCAHWSAEITEAKAIEMAMRLGKRFGLHELYSGIGLPNCCITPLKE